MRPTPEQFQAYLRRLGIDDDSRVVITQRGRTPGQLAGAARLYWHFKYYGFRDVALLDGGNAGWVEALEDRVDEPAQPSRPGNYRVGSEHAEILATLSQVRAATRRKGVTLIDTRNLRYHIGLDKKSYVYGYGHIPGARLLPYKFLTPAKGTQRYFKADRLKRIIGDLNIDAGDELILFCNSAYECSSNWFALHEILGLPRVRIYDGSLHQWTQYEDNPMETRVVF
jgi:thiosulfate/3-mercaptopyruvate sulfurtransferase